MNGTVHEDTGDMPCTEHDPANVLNYDAETQCEPLVLLDAETQYEKLLKRGISIQTLAPRKKKAKKSKKPSTPLNPNVNCPVGTPSTPTETKQHKPSTALYHNGSVASLASALTVMTETDTTTPQYEAAMRTHQIVN